MTANNMRSSAWCAPAAIHASRGPGRWVVRPCRAPRTYKTRLHRCLWVDMKSTTIKVAVLSVLLVLLASACSRTTQRGRNYGLDPNKPQFTIAPADLAAAPVLGTNSGPSGAHATIVLRVEFTATRADAFHKFTRDHRNQQTQLVVRSKVVAEPFVAAEIPDGRVELAFSSIDEARGVRAWLSKK